MSTHRFARNKAAAEIHHETRIDAYARYSEAESAARVQWRDTGFSDAGYLAYINAIRDAHTSYLRDTETAQKTYDKTKETL